jgi:hypothetical protein
MAVHGDEDNDFKSTNVVVHEIKTGDATPIRHHTKPFYLRQEMNRQGQKLLQKSVIRQEMNRQGQLLEKSVIRQEMNRQGQKLLEKSVISPSHFPW